MTVERLSQKTYTYTRRFSSEIGGSPILNDLEWDPEIISSINPPVLIPDKVTQNESWHSKRKRFLADILWKLRGRDIPCKEHVEEYLRDQHRRNCKPNTLRNSFLGIDVFLKFLEELVD